MKAVLVTGANGALGSVVCSTLELSGWEVIRATSSQADLRSQESAEEFVRHHAKNICALVHTVGGITAGLPAYELTLEQLMDNVVLNLVTTFTVVRAALPLLKANAPGSIVTIGARDVLHPSANRSAYAAAKAAVVSFTQCIAEEGKQYGVRANCVAPSVLRTKANESWGSPSQIPTWVTPEAVANTIQHLIDPSCDVSGAVIPLYGRIPF